ncbi:DUF7507 domain-containing protein [Microbacterium sp.]|uniref:DUF7507 domain-containing protein n=1 Tax=Microbacterium sp. TaxID=51671 RepID=UPI003C743A2B
MFGRSSHAHTRRNSIAASLASLAVVVASLVTPVAASAAGPAAPLAVPGGTATVSTSVDYVSGLDLSTPITELKATYGSTAPTQYFALNIGYTCGSASDCTDVSIAIAPQQLDSIYGQYRFARYSSSTLPTGASISGSAAAGYVVRLGDLAAGATGAFTVVYVWQDRGLSVAPQSFFLDGEKIRNTVTIDAANVGATATAFDEITWHIDTMAPQVSFATQGLARAGENYDYVLRMGSDCMWYRSTANHGEPSKLCAASYTNTFHLPEGAEYVGTSPDGTYDAAARTVTWTASGPTAATGWGSANGFSIARTVTVKFPEALFADPCTASVTASFDADVVYLDGQQKQAQTEVTHEVTACAPFALATPVEKTASRQLNPNIVWDNGAGNSYDIRVGNKANVPGVAVITDDKIGADHIRAYEVNAVGAQIAYVLDDGTTGTATERYVAPSARRIVSVVVTTPELAGPNKDQSATPLTEYYTMRVKYVTVGKAPDEGWPLTNTASAVMTYPGTTLADYDEGSDTTDMVITPRPANFNSAISAASSTPGDPVIGTPVNYTVYGVTSSMEPTDTVEPQYVFLAPANWEIIADSWSLAAGAPDGAIFERKTVTVSGVERDALYVHWPAGTVWGVNATWPKLSVQATPTAAATPGSVGVANGLVGDASHSFPGYASTWGGNNNGQRWTDQADLDGDGITTENFASANASAIRVGSAAALGSTKEICLPDPAAADGCDWVSDSTQAAPISPVATDITYRVTLRNDGNSALSSVVAYDVLPHVGDTGVSSGSASIPRNSDFAESVSTVSSISPSVTLAYSDSTDPCRPQVYAGGPTGCTDDWDSSAADSVAIRAEVAGGLSAGESVSFVYTAKVLGSPAAGEQACNSIATSASGVPVSEPSPVCVVVQAADLAVTAGDPGQLQLGRPGVLPFTVSNESGTDAETTVTVDIPAGVQVTDLAVGDWTCTAGTATAPVDGPAVLTCTSPTMLADGDTVPLNVPVIITSTGGAVTATAGSDLFDPVPGNNSDSLVPTVADAATTGLTVSKDDGLPAVVAGQQSTYTIRVGNQLVGEDISNVEIVDTLPAGVAFVSASDGGTHDAGVVTWNLSSLAAAGTAEVTVTVRVPDDATGTMLTNAVSATAADPAFPGLTLTGSASDVDHLDRISLTKSVAMRAPGDALDPRSGDVLEYTFVIANIGGGELTDIVLTDAKPGLSAITFPDGWPTTEGTLSAGESVTAVATYTLMSADIDAGITSNTASVVGLSAGGEQARAESGVDLDLPQTGGIVLTKDAHLDLSDTVRAGDEVDYSFTITNTGNVTLHDVDIADPLPGLSTIAYEWPGAAGVLTAGAPATATATYTLTQADVDAGRVSNTATASARDVDDAEVTSSAQAEVVIPAVATATFTKQGELATTGADPVAGDKAEFSFEIENTGNVTINAIEIVDHLAGVSTISFDDWPAVAGQLAPGEKIAATAGYSLTQKDIDAGAVKNTATLLATPARGDAVSEDADAVVKLTQAPGLKITKAAELLDGNGDGQANPGERIRYSFQLENTGNVTLTDVTVDDPMVSGTPVTAQLAPGQVAVVFAAAYTVTSADAAAGSVRNTATATATAPGGKDVTSDPSSTVTSAKALGGLATTGGELGPLIGWAAGVLVGTGALLMLLAMRRRKRARA